MADGWHLRAIELRGREKARCEKVADDFYGVCVCVCHWTWNWKSKKLFNQGRTSGCHLYFSVGDEIRGVELSLLHLQFIALNEWYLIQFLYILLCAPTHWSLPLHRLLLKALLIVVVRMARPTEGKNEEEKSFRSPIVSMRARWQSVHMARVHGEEDTIRSIVKPNTNIIDMHSSSPGSSSYLCSSAPFFFARVVGRERVQVQVAQLPGSYPTRMQ